MLIGLWRMKVGVSSFLSTAETGISRGEYIQV